MYGTVDHRLYIKDVSHPDITCLFKQWLASCTHRHRHLLFNLTTNKMLEFYSPQLKHRLLVNSTINCTAGDGICHLITLKCNKGHSTSISKCEE